MWSGKRNPRGLLSIFRGLQSAFWRAQDHKRARSINSFSFTRFESFQELCRGWEIKSEKKIIFDVCKKRILINNRMVKYWLIDYRRKKEGNDKSNYNKCFQLIRLLRLVVCINGDTVFVFCCAFHSSVNKKLNCAENWSANISISSLC